MLHRMYAEVEILRLEEIVGGAPIRAVAEVSRGPWYGFDGIQALVLTDEMLHRVVRGFAIRRNQVVDSFPLAELSEPRWDLRPGRRSGRISFRVSGRRHSYASKWLEAAEMAESLA